MRWALAGVFVAIAGQLGYWNYTHLIKPELSVVPAVPSERTLHALAFGEEEAFFRLLGLNLQNAGDMFGQFTPLYKYDYNKLQQWFQLLDGLNKESNFVPAMATYYFSQTQNPSDVRYIVDYLDSYTKDRAKEKWWWVVQGTYLAQHKLYDLDRAAEFAERLRGVRGIPVWAQQMPAFISEQRGEFSEAMAIIQEILAHKEDYSLGELRFMRYFIKERIGKMQQLQEQLDAIEAEKQEQMQKAQEQGITLPEKDNGPPSDVGALEVPGMGK